MAQRLTDLAPGTPTLASLIWFADMTQPAGSRDRVATLQVIAAALGVAIGYVAATDPGVDDDETEGYGQLSLGLNTATEALFICVDPTEGAAVWVPLGGGAVGGPLTINAQTGTSYTPVLADGDGNTLVTLANGANISVTIPTNAAVAYPVGTVLVFQQMGAGQVLVVGDTGVTINGTTPGDEALTDAQYMSQGVLVKHATDVWTLTGWVE